MSYASPQELVLCYYRSASIYAHYSGHFRDITKIRFAVLDDRGVIYRYVFIFDNEILCEKLRYFYDYIYKPRRL